jgi:hypothetical protein
MPKSNKKGDKKGNKKQDDKQQKVERVRQPKVASARTKERRAAQHARRLSKKERHLTKRVEKLLGYGNTCIYSPGMTLGRYHRNLTRTNLTDYQKRQKELAKMEALDDKE